MIFLDSLGTASALGYLLKGDEGRFIVVMNANPEQAIQVHLPAGKWSVLVDGERAGASAIRSVSGTLAINPRSGCVLRLKKVQ